MLNLKQKMEKIGIKGHMIYLFFKNEKKNVIHPDEMDIDIFDVITNIQCLCIHRLKY